MRARTLTPLVALTFLLGACVTDQGGKQVFGTLAGAAAGGFLGSKIGGGTGQLAAIAGGTLLGGLIGNQIGRTMDDVDRLQAGQALADAQTAPIGETIQWNNPETGNYGTVTPMRGGYTADGAYCREFQQTVTVGNRAQEAYGTACRQPDGSWKMVQG